MFIERISPSKKSVVDQCLLKYKLRYIDRLDGDESPNKEAFSFGKYVHRIFELGASASSYPELRDIATAISPTYPINEENSKKLDTCLRNFLIWNEKFINSTISLEREFSIQMFDDFYLNGIIDRVVSGTGGGILVIDYKTSKTEKTKIELKGDDQGKAYVYAIHREMNIPIPKIFFSHYYPISNTLVPVQYSPMQIAQFAQEIKGTVWKVRKLKKTEFHPKENKFCNWCEYKSLCPLFNDPMECTRRLDEAIQRKKDKESDKATEITLD